MPRLILILALSACSSGADVDSGTDATMLDSGTMDSTVSDTGPNDSGADDSGAADASDSATADGGDAGDGGCAEPLVTGYRDGDSDGHGAGEGREVCPGAEGFVLVGDDCDDDDSDVFPRQTMFFATPRASGGFDYDCNGREVAEHRMLYMCETETCTLLSAGFGPPIPSCGEVGNWVTDCTGSGGVCGLVGMMETQRCR